MSENDDKSVRRFGRRDRKDRLPETGKLFPDDELDENEAILPPDIEVELDMDSLNLPDMDTGALEMLSSLRDEVKAPKITPDEERYPPIAPVATARQISTDEAIPPPAKNNFFINFITLLLIVGTVVNLVWFFIIWDDPQSVWNPFPPATPFVEVVVTPDSGDLLTIDATPDDSGQIFVVITDTPVPTAVSTESPFPFVAGEILYAPNSNELACNWWSIAGTVTDTDGNPIQGYRIRVVGDDVDESVFSGASLAFGDGGYELPLIGTPRVAEFTVQLFSSQDAPLSDEFAVTTRADCESNVLILNFIENR